MIANPHLALQVVIDRLISSACFSQQRGLAIEPLSSYQVRCLFNSLCVLFVVCIRLGGISRLCLTAVGL
jgi:hypothetical protein